MLADRVQASTLTLILIRLDTSDSFHRMRKEAGCRVF